MPELPGLRPTGDRIRETLFNWIGSRIVGARVLDPFAGTGALGFEAASRGAAEVLMLDRHPVVVQELRRVATELDADNVSIRQADALSALSIPPEAAYDLVMLDPPFETNLLDAVFELVVKNAWVEQGGIVYLEFAQAGEEPRLPVGWSWRRRRRAGGVEFGLMGQDGDQR